MSLADDYAASLDPRVISQVTAAIYAFAETVDNEVNTTPNHAVRVTLANLIVTGQKALPPLVTHVCCFAHVTGLSTAPTSDTTVNNAVAACWNLWAGA